MISLIFDASEWNKLPIQEAQLIGSCEPVYMPLVLLSDHLKHLQVWTPLVLFVTWIIEY